MNNTRLLVAVVAGGRWPCCDILAVVHPSLGHQDTRWHCLWHPALQGTCGTLQHFGGRQTCRERGLH